MGRMTFKKMLILGTLVGAGVGAYMLLTKRVPELPGMPKGSMSLAVTPSAGGQYKRVKVTATVQATEGTTPISLNGTITVYDQTFGTEVETKTWTDTIYDLSMKILEEEQQRAIRLDEKASKYFSVISLLIGIYGVFAHKILTNSIPFKSWLDIILVSLGIVVLNNFAERTATSNPSE